MSSLCHYVFLAPKGGNDMWLSRAHLPIASPFPNPFQFREFGGMDRKFYVFTNLFPVEISDDRPLRCTPKWSSTFYSAPMGPTFWSRARWAPQWQGLKMQSSMRRASTLACSSSLRIKRRQIEDMNRVHKRDGCVIRAHFTDWTNSALPPVLDWYWFYLALIAIICLQLVLDQQIPFLWMIYRFWGLCQKLDQGQSHKAFNYCLLANDIPVDKQSPGLNIVM